MNNQKPEKKDYRSGKSLYVHSIFNTIQGEGPRTGQPAVFLRLAGCNLQCPGCDTDYTSGRVHMALSLIEREISRAATGGSNLIVITGGEPFRQDIIPLCNRLVDSGYRVQIETNGTIAPPSIKELDYDVEIVCSPKAGKINKLILPRITALKYVLHENSVAEDGLPILALQHTANPQVARVSAKDIPIYLQPMDCGNEAQNKANLDAAIASCMEHGYLLQLQTHKVIGLE